MRAEAVGGVAEFLRAVLRNTWPSLTAILCGAYVDGARPRGTCGTHAQIIVVPLFLASLCLCAAVIGLTLLRIARRRNAATVVSTVVNAYAVTVTLVLSIPYFRV